MPNRLANESSPYLQQHADNPVDWYPWGEEALEKAREEDKPILLSIGYSSCHWCHVMAHESFEDEETARLMNEAFVNVKVDREERPDLDSVYMQAIQSITGRGGWPLTAFLTPDGVPYYGGTYFPPEPRQGMPSFHQVLRAARDAYRNRKDEVESSARQMKKILERSMSSRPGDGGEPGERPLEEALLRRAFQEVSSRFDHSKGGLGGAPKFPQPVTFELVLRWHLRSGEKAAREMVVHTLTEMARGGIRDHLGGGFHRYSVDARWLVPHFEKMLYDNAQLASLYLHAWQVTGQVGLRRVAEETLEYILRDLRSSEGGFYSARDADSEDEEGHHEEGAYYVWTPEEIDERLDPEVADLFKRCYDVSPGGNWEEKSILHLPHDLEAVARGREMELRELEERLATARETLLEARGEREPPFRDEKVLACWNGLAIRALAEAGAALDRNEFLNAARTAASFLLDALRTGDRLLRVWKDGEARVRGFLEDYAALGNALLTLHEVTLEERWLQEARWMAEGCLELFWEEDEDAFFDTPSDGEELVVRPRSVMDNPTPSGTSLAVELLLRLGHLLDDDRYRDVAGRVLAREAPALERFPTAFGGLLSALDFRLSTPVEVAVVGDPDAEDTHDLLRALHRPYLPNRVVTGRAPDQEGPTGVPLLQDRKARAGKATAYVCRDYACREPTTDPETLAAQLAETPGPGGPDGGS